MFLRRFCIFFSWTKLDSAWKGLKAAGGWQRLLPGCRPLGYEGILPAMSLYAEWEDKLRRCHSVCNVLDAAHLSYFKLMECLVVFRSHSFKPEGQL